ncbi:hypothetical protein MED01_006666 [Micromonospora sp. MED01]|uniref:hypothetical protein n=1 Tax=Micromonospora alfalfae TaxID=2911212 RepID=UPI001EE974DD|nr:hypothetical protein [Micromonospora alfalfae]MCG5461795.1 hypothetical protein [Micromonospora alfalfae]
MRAAQGVCKLEKEEEVLHPARSLTLRRWFFASLILAAVIIVLVRFLLIPDSKDAADWQGTLAAILDNLLAATATSLAIGVAYVVLLPKLEVEQVEIIQPRLISGALEAAARDCTRWSIRARTASYFARVVAPLLRDNALRAGGSIEIKVQLLDPGNDKALEAYARYRSNRPGASAVWSAARVRTEICSTILAMAVYRNEAPRLEIEVGLSSDFWVLSLDLCDEIAFITGQNKGQPCLCVRRTSQLFSGWREDFEAGFLMCRIIRPSAPGLRLQDLHRPTAATLGVIRTLFESVGILGMQDSNLKEIAAYMRREHNYA